MSTAFLAFDLDIVRMVAEEVMERPVEKQYLLFFETWYKSVLMTRKIKSENITEDERVLRL